MTLNDSAAPSANPHSLVVKSNINFKMSCEIYFVTFLQANKFRKLNLKIN